MQAGQPIGSPCCLGQTCTGNTKETNTNNRGDSEAYRNADQHVRALKEVAIPEFRNEIEHIGALTRHDMVTTM